MSEEKKLEQTKGSVKLRGVVTRLNSDNAYTYGTASSGKDWRRLRFMIKTSENEHGVNEIPVELFAMERDQVYAYNRTKKEGQKFDWDQRKNLPQGYAVMGVRVGLSKGEDGKTESHNFVEYDAVDEIYNNLEDGMSVFINAEVEFSEYEGQDGTVRQQKRYALKSISLTKDEIDFDDEKFSETAAFEQEFVFVDMDLDKETKKAYVVGRLIGYGDRWSDGQFVIDGNDEDLAKLIPQFKKVKFGTLMKVYGKVLNKAELSEVEEEIEIDKSNPFASYNGKKKDSSLEKRMVKTYVNELQIEGVDLEVYEPKKYTEDDFVVTVSIQEEKPKSENPFANEDDLEDDDLWS